MGRHNARELSGSLSSVECLEYACYDLVVFILVNGICFFRNAMVFVVFSLLLLLDLDGYEVLADLTKALTDLADLAKVFG